VNIPLQHFMWKVKRKIVKESKRDLSNIVQKFPWQRNCIFLFWAGEGQGQGIGISPLHGLIKICAAPKGMVFELFLSEKYIDFDHIGLKWRVFFTLAWHWVLC